ncbi:hypothetical protein P167DRAFT_538343 [Morchella conica CCBAS932]|uniref:NAD(P)-binding protein n=1 Tax=Morchella conica CCBAS932 TaxID=1392247 RepID=A0A3N4KGJ2_9PEZI|nr:hypothetical protein P167DRAFT_538343 [Morchella conica CCBAS932]
MRIIAAVGEEESYGGECDAPRAQEVPGQEVLEETAPEETLPENDGALTQRHQSSWTQKLADIPYQDIGDVLAINSFVPLLLIRELLPLMGHPPPTSTSTTQAPEDKPTKPAGYIINVSSREGLSEASPDASIKGGHHVHTNMSKAALNMITETEAHPAWAGRRVAMNSVDPGFMSAADGSECPIGWADGAARVLWCVAKGEVEGEAVWGRFLKHFGGVEAVVRGV